MFLIADGLRERRCKTKSKATELHGTWAHCLPAEKLYSSRLDLSVIRVLSNTGASGRHEQVKLNSSWHP